MPVASITIVSMPHAASQSAIRRISSVNVPKVRTGSGSRSGADGRVELGEARHPAEDAVEPGAQGGPPRGRRLVLVELQVGVEPHGVIAREPAGDAGGGLAVPLLVEPEGRQPPSRGISAA